MSRYIAAYDVGHTGSRAKVARVLAEYGARLQLSVFEVEVEVDDIPLLQRRVGALLGAEDRFDLVPIDGDQRRPRLTWPDDGVWDAAVVFL